jgi:hypothetical protein
MLSVRKPSDAMGTDTTVAGGRDEPDPNIVNPAAAAETGLFRSADAKAAPPTSPIKTSVAGLRRKAFH